MALQTLASLANADGEGADLLMASNVLPRCWCDSRRDRSARNSIRPQATREAAREGCEHRREPHLPQRDKHRGTFMMHGTAEALQGLMVQERAGYVQLRAAMALADLVGGNEEFSGRVVKQITEVLRHAVHGTDFWAGGTKSPSSACCGSARPSGQARRCRDAGPADADHRAATNGEYDETIGKLAQDVVSQIHTVRPSQFLDKHGLGSFDPGDFPVSDVKFAKYAKSEEKDILR